MNLSLDPDLLSFGVTEEVVRPHVLPEHDVVVEVDELLRQAWDSVDVGLNGRGTEGGQVGVVLEDILHRRDNHMATWIFFSLTAGPEFFLIRSQHPICSVIVNNHICESSTVGLRCTWCVTTVTRGLSRFSQEGICPLVTMKMCRTQGACLSTERSE